jgi:1-acyl-sn-glycerol-3-phosphate acyltransferase
MLQAAARWPQRVYAIVKADIQVESSAVGWVMAKWCRNLGAIFYTRGDKSSGAVRQAPAPRRAPARRRACTLSLSPQTVRSKIAEFKGTVLVFPEGTTQAYGPPMLEKMRLGSIDAAFESGKLVQPVRSAAARRSPALTRPRARPARWQFTTACLLGWASGRRRTG